MTATNSSIRWSPSSASKSMGHVSLPAKQTAKAKPKSKAKKDASVKRPALTRDDYNLMMGAINTRTVTGVRQAAQTAALYWLGLRTIEYVEALREDFDLDKGMYYPRSRAKGGVASPIAIHAECLPALRAWDEVRPDSEFMFCAVRRNVSPKGKVTNAGDQLTTQQVRKTWRTLRARAGVADRYVCHSARHGAAQLRMGGGWSMRAIQDYLGHTSLATTQRYLDGMTEAEKKDATDAL